MYRSDQRLPTLLDRLIESAPGQGTGMSKHAYLQSVLRDLQWLLSTQTWGKDAVLPQFAEINRSVLNYGIPNSTGMALTEEEMTNLVQTIEKAILTYEPRIIPERLAVTILTDRQVAIRSHLILKINLSYWFTPQPLDMVAHAQWDIESGLVSLQYS